MPISGRTCVVTGGGNGLGRAIAQSLAAEGARVILVGRDAGKLHVTADELAWRAGVRLAAVDVANPASVDALRTTLDDEDVSILINNAGIPGPVAPLVDVTPAEWDEVFATNVRGAYLMSRAFIPAMVQAGRGDIINIGSVSGKRPLANRTPYCASKMAVLGLTISLAAEVGELGVNVNCLSPGPVEGPRMARVLRLDAERRGISYADAERAFVSRSILRRMVREDEIGAAVVAMLNMPGLCAADIDLSAGMVAR